jgi:hypothetical protein
MAFPDMMRFLAYQGETFEKCSILFKVKPPARWAYAPEGKAKILTRHSSLAG